MTCFLFLTFHMCMSFQPFSARKQWFHKQLLKQSETGVFSPGSMEDILIARESLFTSSCHQLLRRDPNDLKKNLVIKFKEEDGMVGNCFVSRLSISCQIILACQNSTGMQAHIGVLQVDYVIPYCAIYENLSPPTQLQSGAIAQTRSQVINVFPSQQQSQNKLLQHLHSQISVGSRPPLLTIIYFSSGTPLFYKV